MYLYLIRKKNWIGHIMRADSLQKVRMERREEGKRKTETHALDDGVRIRETRRKARKREELSRSTF